MRTHNYRMVWEDNYSEIPIEGVQIIFLKNCWSDVPETLVIAPARTKTRF